MDPMVAKNLRLLLMRASENMAEDQKYYVQNLLVDGNDLSKEKSYYISMIRADMAKRAANQPLHAV